MSKLPNMDSKGKKPLAVFPVNGTYLLAVYAGNLSEFDLLLKYRQKDGTTKSGWSRVRTPKHMHWAVDVLLKMHSDKAETEKFLDFLIHSWDNAIKPLKSNQERKELLNVTKLTAEITAEAKNYEALAGKGEYSMRFLILIAKLLMVQEKTNMEKAFMFRDLLKALKHGKDIFKIVSIATHR